MRKTRRTILLVIVLPILAMAGMTLAFISRVKYQFAKHIPGVISMMASERVNGSIKLGEVEVYPMGFVIRDVSITGEGSKTPIASAPQIKIACRISDIVFGKVDPAKSIRKIEITRPTVFLERDSHGGWNVARLLKPGKKAETAFTGKVIVRDAQVAFRDSRPDAAKPRVTRVSDVNAILDFAKDPEISFKAWGKGQKSQFVRFIGDGAYHKERHSYTADIDIVGANAAFVTKYPWRIGLDVASGTANGTVHLSKPAMGKPLVYRVDTRVRRASVKVPGFTRPLTDVTGPVSISGGKVAMDLRARLGKSPLTVSGSVSDFRRPTLGIQVASDRADVREIASLMGGADSVKQLRIPQTARVKAHISGPLRAFNVRFAADTPSVSWQRISAGSVSVNGIYTGGRVFLHKASANALGGRIESSGSVRLGRTPEVDLSGRATGLRLAQVPEAARARLTSTTSGDFDLAVKGKSVRVHYKGSADSFTHSGFRFDNPQVDLSYIDGKIVLHEVSTRTMGGLVAASGTVTLDGRLSLDVSGADINLAQVRDLYWKAPTVGRGEFRGHVTGTIKRPVFQGEVGASKVMFSGIGVERIAGIVTASRDRVTLDDVTAYRYPGKVTFSGTVLDPTEDSASVDLVARADSLDVSGLAGAYGRHLPEGGLLSGEIRVSGNPLDPIAEADLRIAGGTVHGVELDALNLAARYEESNISITDLSAQAGDSSLTASGEVTGDGEITARFESRHIDLARVGGFFLPYANVSGSIVLSGEIGGTLEEPEARVSLACEDPVVNGQSFSRIKLAAALTDGMVTVTDVAITDRTATYAVPSLAYDPNSGDLEFTANVRQGRLGTIAAILRGSPAADEESAEGLRDFLSALPKPFSGTVNADLSGSIGLADDKPVPDLTVDLSLADLKFGENSFKSVALKGLWKDDVARIEKLDAADGDMSLTAQGSVGPSDALDLKLDAKSFDVATVCRWLNLSHNFSGKANVTLVASGTTHAPSSELNLDIENPAAGEMQFDRLTGHLSLAEAAPDDGSTAPADGDRISIRDLTLKLGEQDLVVSGYVPISLDTFTLAKDVPLLIQSNLDSDSLAILSKFTGLGLETASSGQFRGLIKLSGTVESPVFEGNLDWTDGLVQIPRLNTPLENVTAHMTLVGDKVTIEQIFGQSPEGGSFEVAGSISFAGLKPSLDMEVKTNGLRISGRNFTNKYGEDIRARLQGSVKITDSWRSPLIAGSVDIPEGSIALPRKPGKSKVSDKPAAMDPRFDLKVSLGEDVRFGAARLKAPLVGSMNVAGSLSSPKVAGTVDISGGSILFPMRRMKILTGSTLTVRMNPGMPAAADVNLRAQTKLSSMSAWGRPRRYTVTMEATGPYDKMNMEFTSSPPDLTQERIVALLAGQGELESILAQDGTSNFGKDISGIVSTALMPSVFEPIEETLENTLGIEEFSLDMGYREPLQLTIGQRLVDGLYLDYTAALGARPDYSDSMYELKLSYRWKHGLELGVATDENKTLKVGIEGKLRF